MPRRKPLSLAYVVRVTFDDPAIVTRYLPWLRAHAAAVCAAGASAAEIVVVDGAPSVEVRYVFPSREELARYEREDAPRLRGEGLAELERLGAAATFSRWTGEIVPPP